MENLIKKKFYDTNALLMFQNKLPDEVFYISSVTFHELEYIKTSKNKDDNIKYKARKITRLLDENFYQYIPIIYNNVILEYINIYIYCRIILFVFSP